MNRSVWFPGDLAERVEQEATRLDRSFNWVVVKALESALKVGGEPDAPVASSPTAAAPSRVSVAPVIPSSPSEGDLLVGHPDGDREFRGGKWRQPAKPLPPGVKSARELAMERQRKMNERKS